MTLPSALNAMITIMMARFMLNEVPHALGLIEPQQQAISKWKEILKYCHTVEDLRKIASSTGTIYVYHGAPTAYAEAMVKSGPNVPYKVEDTARHVADLYGIPYRAFAPVAYRRYEEVTKLSASTAPVAARWAWSFPLGEVLSELNAQARMYLAAKKLSLEKGISINDAHDKLADKALEISHETGLSYSTNAAPDLLGLPNRLALDEKTGALVQIEIDANALHKVARHDAEYYLKDIDEGEATAKEALMHWNNSYIDFRLYPEDVKAMKIVVRDMKSGQQDIVEGLIKEGKLSAECG